MLVDCAHGLALTASRPLFQQVVENVQIRHDADTMSRTKTLHVGRIEMPDTRVQRISAFPSAAVYKTGSSSGSDNTSGRTITGSMISATSAKFPVKRAASLGVI